MRRIFWPLTFGIIGTLILLGLGLWQLDRLGQKLALISAIDARIGAEPGVLPPEPMPERDRFAPVVVKGHFTNDEAFVITSAQGLGPGFRVIAAFVTDGGRRVMIDRGFIAEAERALPRPVGPATVTGNLVWPQEKDSYTPAPDIRAGLWFARDIPAMAQVLGTEPVMIALRKSNETGAVPMPLPVDSGTIRNDHLQYAITWFLLACVWAGMTGYLVWRIRRQEN